MESIKIENDLELETTTPTNSNHSTRIRVENNQRKFLKLACKTERGLEWVTAKTTATGLSIELVVDDEGQAQEQLVESSATPENLLKQTESEWFGQVSDEREQGYGLDERDEGNSDDYQAGTTNKSQDRVTNKADELFWFLFNLPTAPLNGVFGLKEWYAGKYKYIDKNSAMVKTISNLIKLKYCELSVEGIYDHVMSCEKMYYAATFGNFSEYYYDVDESIEVLNNILVYQLKDEVEIKSFLKNLYDVLNKNLPIINTFFVHCNQNGGQSLFFDAVVHYCINFGKLGNFNAFSLFPFQDCLNRRILLWKDPNVEASAWETVKYLCGGDAIYVKINQVDDFALLGRTPLIVLASSSIFPKYEEFNTRFTYTWRGYPDIKNVKKKPLPIAIYHLFTKYNIISRFNTTSYDVSNPIDKTANE